MSDNVFLICRTEVFGKMELGSYRVSVKKTSESLSVVKAEIIKKILLQREYPSYGTYKDYGHQQEDRFYIYQVRNGEDAEAIADDFYETLFPYNPPHVLKDHPIPEGWEEIIPENYILKEVAFRI